MDPLQRIVICQREALLGTTAALVAAIDLLRRGGKRAAPSDRMFSQMLADYEGYVAKAREALGMTDNGAFSGAGSNAE